MGSFLGNAVGDALGAHTEFSAFNPQRKLLEVGKTLSSCAQLGPN